MLENFQALVIFSSIFVALLKWSFVPAPSLALRPGRLQQTLPCVNILHWHSRPVSSSSLATGRAIGSRQLHSYSLALRTRRQNTDNVPDGSFLACKIAMI